MLPQGPDDAVKLPGPAIAALTPQAPRRARLGACRGAGDLQDAIDAALTAYGAAGGSAHWAIGASATHQDALEALSTSGSPPPRPWLGLTHDAGAARRQHPGPPGTRASKAAGGQGGLDAAWNLHCYACSAALDAMEGKTPPRSLRGSRPPSGGF